MLRTTDDYLGKITPYQSGNPNFMATIAATVAPFADIAAFLAALPTAFDLDTALDAQLDILGQWIGRSRNIPVPLPSPWFAFDDPVHGFDRAPWQIPYYSNGSALTALDTETYRRLLKAKAAANSWDGTVASAQAILDIFFTDPTTYVFIEDRTVVANMNEFFAFDDPLRGFDVGVWYVPGMSISTLPRVSRSMTIGVAGNLPPIVDLEVLGQDLIPVKPAGVALDFAVTSVDGAPVFGFDMTNDYVAGFDVGAWGVTPDYAATHAP